MKNIDSEDKIKKYLRKINHLMWEIRFKSKIFSIRDEKLNKNEFNLIKAIWA